MEWWSIHFSLLSTTVHKLRGFKVLLNNNESHISPGYTNNPMTNGLLSRDKTHSLFTYLYIDEVADFLTALLLASIINCRSQGDRFNREHRLSVDIFVDKYLTSFSTRILCVWGAHQALKVGGGGAVGGFARKPHMHLHTGALSCLTMTTNVFIYISKILLT